MAESFSEAHRVLKPGGQLTVVYAHKTTLGWSTLVDSLRKAGFIVTEAWPLDTEMKARLLAMGTAALASSIFLVARKRDAACKAGNYEVDVVPELGSIVRERVDTLWEMGIAGHHAAVAWPTASGEIPDEQPRFQIAYLPLGFAGLSAKERDAAALEMVVMRFRSTFPRSSLASGCHLASLGGLPRSGIHTAASRSSTPPIDQLAVSSWQLAMSPLRPRASARDSLSSPVQRIIVRGHLRQPEPGGNRGCIRPQVHVVQSLRCIGRLDFLRPRLGQNRRQILVVHVRIEKIAPQFDGILRRVASATSSCT